MAGGLRRRYDSRFHRCTNRITGDYSANASYLPPRELFIGSRIRALTHFGVGRLRWTTTLIRDEPGLRL
jgi:hypothetical protein